MLLMMVGCGTPSVRGMLRLPRIYVRDLGQVASTPTKPRPEEDS